MVKQQLVLTRHLVIQLSGGEIYQYDNSTLVTGAIISPLHNCLLAAWHRLRPRRFNGIFFSELENGKCGDTLHEAGTRPKDVHLVSNGE